MEDSKKFPEKSEGSDVESKDVENRDLESRDVESRDVDDYSDLEDGLEQLKKEESQSSANDIELKDYKEVCFCVKLNLLSTLNIFTHLFTALLYNLV